MIQTKENKVRKRYAGGKENCKICKKKLSIYARIKKSKNLYIIKNFYTCNYCGFELLYDEHVDELSPSVVA